MALHPTGNSRTAQRVSVVKNLWKIAMISKILILLAIVNYAQAQHLSHNQGFPPHQHSLGCVCSNFIFLNIHGELVSIISFFVKLWKKLCIKIKLWYVLYVCTCMYGIQLIHKSQIVQKIGQKIVLKLDKNCAKNWAKD